MAQSWPRTKYSTTHTQDWHTHAHTIYCHTSRTQHNNLALNYDNQAAVCKIFPSLLTKHLNSSPQQRVSNWEKSHLPNKNNINKNSGPPTPTSHPKNYSPNCTTLTFWVSPSFNRWPLQSSLSYCGGKHTNIDELDGNIHINRKVPKNLWVLICCRSENRFLFGLSSTTQTIRENAFIHMVFKRPVVL